MKTALILLVLIGASFAFPRRSSTSNAIQDIARAFLSSDSYAQRSLFVTAKRQGGSTYEEKIAKADALFDTLEALYERASGEAPEE